MDKGSGRVETSSPVDDSWEDTVEKLVIMSFLDVPDF
jgi:hypothetical protein